jgi:hypothetical protein
MITKFQFFKREEKLREGKKREDLTTQFQQRSSNNVVPTTKFKVLPKTF